MNWNPFNWFKKIEIPKAVNHDLGFLLINCTNKESFKIRVIKLELKDGGLLAHSAQFTHTYATKSVHLLDSSGTCLSIHEFDEPIIFVAGDQVTLIVGMSDVCEP